MHPKVEETCQKSNIFVISARAKAKVVQALSLKLLTGKTQRDYVNLETSDSN
jgi:hypothetical protein